MLRKLLIADDEELNRLILKKILSSEYDIIEAADGEQALAELEKGCEQISAVLLDLRMPILDGFEVLRRMRASAALSDIPVIVATASQEEDAEVKALTLGANDFITKPYNPALIIHCLRNTINLRETASIINALQRDKLTGLYNRETFFDKAGAMIKSGKSGDYILSCFDIENFKYINEQFGAQEGDLILREVGIVMREDINRFGGIVGRITADNFVALYPSECSDFDFTRRLKSHPLAPTIRKYSLTISVGRCLVADTSLNPSAIYDRAYMAKRSVKGRYDANIAYFDDEMLKRLISEREITAEMDSALSSRQFEVWYQPQFNHANGALIGAEALVRWRHPVKGMISPGEFIPIFESNGFVYEIDKFVWEESCAFLRARLDEGLSPLPISVNVSRCDIIRAGLVEHLNALLEKYSLPRSLLRLEVTESAFTASSARLIEVITRLVECGYTIEIDDFGSGYSSLNTLKDVPAHVVKLDMKFLKNEGNMTRGGNIVESVVRMLKWLDVSVIAEGVETKVQADFLKSVGCMYVQGFLYERPMPSDEYLRLTRENIGEARLKSLETVENLDNNSFWNPASMETLIFNSYIGGACIYEFCGGLLEMLRLNDKYVSVLGSKTMLISDILKLRWHDYLDDENRGILLSAIYKSIQSREEVTVEARFDGLPGCPELTYLRVSLRVIASAGDRHLVYCMNENITAQREAEKRERRIAAQMGIILAKVTSGISAARVSDDGIDLIFANDRFYSTLGYTKEEYSAEVPDPYALILPEDVKATAAAVNSLIRNGGSASYEYRAKTRDGRIIFVYCTASVAYFEEFNEPLLLSVTEDVTERRETERERDTLMQDIPGGFCRMKVTGTMKVEVLYCNDGFLRLVDMERGDFIREFGSDILSGIHPDDLPELVEKFREDESLEHFNARFRLQRSDGGYVSTEMFARAVKGADGKVYLNTYFSDITAQLDAENQRAELLDNLPCGAALYRYDGSRLAVLHLNRRYRELIGRGRDDPAYIMPLSAVHPDDRASVIKSIGDIAEINRELYFDVRILCSDGEYHLFHIYGRAVAEAGGYINIYLTFIPITEGDVSPHITDDYIKAYERLRVLTDSIQGGLATYRVSGDEVTLLYFNETFCRILGFTRREYERKAANNPLEIIHERDIVRLKEQIKELVENGKSIDFTYRMRIKGDTKWINLRGDYAGRDEGGVLVNTISFDVTDHILEEERLRISEEKFRVAASLGDRTVAIYDIKKRVYHNENPYLLGIGYSREIEDVPETFIRDGLVNPATVTEFKALFDSLAAGEGKASATVSLHTAHGYRWFRFDATVIFDADGNSDQAILVQYDVSEQREKEALYKRWQQSIEAKASSSYTVFRCNISKDSSFDASVGTLLDMTFTSEDMTFDERTAEFAGKLVHPDDRAAYIAALSSDTLIADYYRGKRIKVIEFRALGPSGGSRWLKLTVETVEYPDTSDIQASLMYEDIDALKRAESEVRERAETDPLTGTLNRAAFIERIEGLMKAPDGSLHAMLLLDLDGFKLLNDSFGHDVGDHALIEIAETLTAASREGDIVARLGGDEFIMFVAVDDRASAAKRAQETINMLRKTFNVEVKLSASVGVALSPDDGGDFETLYKKADLALYHVKATGKDNYVFFGDEMNGENPRPDSVNAATKRRMLIVDDNALNREMLAALFRDEFIIDTADNGNNALIRLRRYGSAISVVLLDLIMPGMDGFAVLDKMRSSPEMQSVPIIVVSGMNERETTLRIIKNGASDFVTKPVDADLLRLRVNSAVAKAENERLRAQNSFLALRGSDVARYKAVLDSENTFIIDYDADSGSFVYDRSVSHYLRGEYNSRAFWDILKEDGVCESDEAERIKAAVEEVANTPSNTESELTVELVSPRGIKRLFTIKILRRIDEFVSGIKIIVALTLAKPCSE